MTFQLQLVQCQLVWHSQSLGTAHHFSVCRPEHALTCLFNLSICYGLATDGSGSGTVSPNVSRTIRLIGGSHSWMGRLEILHNSVWGTVCDDLWSDQNSQVVCRQLGFSTASASYRKNAFYGRGSGSIWLDDVSCTGMEQRLEDCNFRGWGSHNCGHHEDVGVSCGMCLC